MSLLNQLKKEVRNGMRFNTDTYDEAVRLFEKDEEVRGAVVLLIADIIFDEMLEVKK